MVDEFRDRFGSAGAAKVLEGQVVDADGAVLDADSVRPAGALVYLYRELPDEVREEMEFLPVKRIEDALSNAIPPLGERLASMQATRQMPLEV